MEQYSIAMAVGLFGVVQLLVAYISKRNDKKNDELGKKVDKILLGQTQTLSELKNVTQNVTEVRSKEMELRGIVTNVRVEVATLQEFRRMSIETKK